MLDRIIPDPKLAFISFTAIFAVLVKIINEYVFDDWQFVITMAVIIMVDTLLGVYKAWRNKQVSSALFSKVFKKMLVYMAILIATHAATHLQANGKQVSLLTWVDSLVYAAIVVREFISILEKAAALGVILPGGILKHLRNFGENSKFTKQ